MSRPRVLVTGAEGYVGRRLAPFLAAHDLDVHGWDAGFFAGPDLFTAERSAVRWRRWDIRDVNVSELRGFDAIVHLAELSNDPLGELNPALTRSINQHGTARLGKAARDAGVRRFLYFSSCSVYGEGGTEPCTENTEPRPQTVYACCKVGSEQALLDLASTDFCAVIFRNATVYGPSPAMRFDLVVNHLSACAHARGSIELTSDGTPWRPLLHIEDLCRAALLGLHAPASVVHGRVFNIGGDEDNYTVRDIAEAVQYVYPDCPIRFGDRGADRRDYRVAFGRAQEELGFKPRRSLREGIGELAALYRQADLNMEQFEEPPYFRVKHIRALIATGQLDEHLRRLHAVLQR
jgi:nucleoside-diphosphate-sugar epimerase